MAEVQEPERARPGEFGSMADPHGRLVRRLDRSLGVAAGIILFLMMVLTVVDVVGRYFFNAPMPGGYELIQFGMAGLVFLILPVVVARDENVRIDFFDRFVPARAKTALAVASAWLGAAVLVGFGIELYRRGASFSVSRETSTNLRLPLAPFAHFMSAVWFLSAAIMLVQGWAKLSRARRGDAAKTEPPQ
ncbi:MAG: TRAP transporter small permease [Alphaproteobacteria bacterium]